MHELSIAMSIVDGVLEQAERLGGVRVAAVHVTLGPLSGVVGGPLVSAWELAREETPLEKAQLIVEEAPIVVHCPVCRGDFPATSLQSLTCSRCGGAPERVVQGAELEITALEVEG